MGLQVEIQVPSLPSEDPIHQNHFFSVASDLMLTE